MRRAVRDVLAYLFFFATQTAIANANDGKQTSGYVPQPIPKPKTVHNNVIHHTPKITEKLANETAEEFTIRLFKNYHRGHRPTNVSAPGATVVKVNLFVWSFSSVSVLQMDYTIDFMLRQRWNDPRLQYSKFNETISLNYMRERLWIPDLFFRNAKHGHLHEITTPNYLIWLKPSGDILFSQKLSLRLSCPMKLWKFPMDTQRCKLEIGSYGYSLNELSFQWMSPNDPKGNVKLNEDLTLNEFHRPTYHTASCNKKYATTGSFSCMYVEFELQRKFGFYLIYTYVPSVLIIIISWVSFLIDFEAVAARISIGLLSVLALITQSAAALQNLPRVSYIKAIDVWLFACLAFDVFSLVEFAFVNVLARTQHSQQFEDKLRKIFREEVSNMEPKPSGEVDEKLLTDATPRFSVNSPRMIAGRPPKSLLKRRHNLMLRQKYRLQAQKVDKFCTWGFPTSFILFNIVYWIYFRILV